MHKEMVDKVKMLNKSLLSKNAYFMINGEDCINQTDLPVKKTVE